MSKQDMKKSEVSIRDKILWTPEEASQMSNIGVNKIRAICDEHPEMVVMSGNRRLIVKTRFEDFLKKTRKV